MTTLTLDDLLRATYLVVNPVCPRCGLSLRELTRPGLLAHIPTCHGTK